MYKLSNLYNTAQCGKGKGKAGPQRVGGGEDVIANLYKHPVKHPLVLYSPELP